MAAVRLLILVLALVCLGAARPAGAQSLPDDVKSRAIEMIGVWTQARRAPTPDARIQLTEKALQLALSFPSWPLQSPSRDDLLGQMWGQLGNEYRRSESGDRAHVMERAIAAYAEALKHFTQERAPQEWGKAQYGLGLAYVDRVRGDRADNMERSIEAFQRAGQAFTRTAAPALWADIQVGLSRSYWHRVRGGRGDNLEQSIAFANNALAVLSREREAADWSRAQAALGAAYWARVKGSRADNLETAIAAYEQALAVTPRERWPKVWAGLQDNIGMAYAERLRGERSENVEKAIAAFGRAEEVLTRAAAPFDWAQLKMNLGNVYLDREASSRISNIEAAIAAYRGALSVYTSDANPERWARVMLNLGNALSERLVGEAADNLEEAVDAYQKALRVYTRESEPFKWAIVQDNLGTVLRKRTKGLRARNLEQAAAAHGAALSVYALDAFPWQHMRASHRAGLIASAQGDWRAAMTHFENAIAASERLFGEGVHGVEAEHVVAANSLQEGTQLFASAAFAAAEQKDLGRALDVLEAGKARLLRASLGLDALALSKSDRDRLSRTRGELRDLESRLELTTGAERSAVLDNLKALRGTVKAMLDSAEAQAPDSPTRKSGTALASALLSRFGAIAAPIVTEQGAKLLIVTRGAAGTSTKSVDLPKLSAAGLKNFLIGVAPSTKPGELRLTGWFGAYTAFNQAPAAEQPAKRDAWLAAIEGLGPSLWAMFGGTLTAALEAAGVPRDAKILWVPQGALGHLPIGLARHPATGESLMDRYTIVLVPNLAAGEVSRRRVEASGATPSLAVVTNPTGDLGFTVPEGAAAASYFQGAATSVLGANSANVANVLKSLKTSSYWHFATHGMAEWEQPRASALLMAANERLTVGHLLDQTGIGNPRLAILSACETAAYDFQRTPDEFVGLPSAFLQAGAAGVLGTLWPVDDVSTALLIIKFYDLHFTERLEPAAALRRAQLWLRDATRRELQAFVGELRAARRLGPQDEGLLSSALADGAPADRPFRHPYYWAAFQFFGA